MVQYPNNSRGDLDSAALDPREIRLGELINEFLDLRSSGQVVTPQEFMTRHPEFATDLSRHFEGLGLLDRITTPADDGTVALTTPRQGLALDGRMASRGSSDVGFAAPLPRIDGYELMREIGRGGMGIVYKAMQRSTQRVCAVKLLLEGHLAGDATRKRFEREVALAAQLRHPNIVPIYDSGECEGRMYYAMEYVHGLPLGTYLKEHNTPLPDRIRLFNQICRAIGHAHLRGVVHRDLKPSNVLVDADGTPHVHDFGLAKSGSSLDMQVSMTAQLVGTPAYMSPEQVAGDPGAIDIRSDIYSAGVMLFEMLTGESPYEVRGNLSTVLNNIQHADPKRPSRVNRQVNDELETIVLKALAKRKEDRYQSMAELAADLERYLSGDPIQAKKASAVYLLRKVIARHRSEAAIAAMAVLVVAGGWSMFRMRDDAVRKQEYASQLEQQNQKLQEMQERYQQMLAQQSVAGLEQTIKQLDQAGPEVQAKFKQILEQGIRNQPGGSILGAPSLLLQAVSQLTPGLGGASAASRPADGTATPLVPASPSPLEADLFNTLREVGRSVDGVLDAAGAPAGAAPKQAGAADPRRPTDPAAPPPPASRPEAPAADAVDSQAEPEQSGAVHAPNGPAAAAAFPRAVLALSDAARRMCAGR